MSSWEKLPMVWSIFFYLKTCVMLYHSPELGHHSSIPVGEARCLCGEYKYFRAARLWLEVSMNGPAQIITDMKGGWSHKIYQFSRCLGQWRREFLGKRIFSTILLMTIRPGIDRVAQSGSGLWPRLQLDVWLTGLDSSPLGDIYFSRPSSTQPSLQLHECL